MAFLTQNQKIQLIQDQHAEEIAHIKATYAQLPTSFSSKAKAYKALGFSYLGAIASSSKIEKSSKVVGVDTYVLYLSPADLAGQVFGRKWNLCPFASAECRMACLADSGRSKMDSKAIITWARLKKSALWFYNRELFMWLLIEEIKAAQKKATKNGNDFAVRLNGTSDILINQFQYDGQNILGLFPDVQFYDYTKQPKQLVNASVYDNYHVTFSYTGHAKNEKIAMRTLILGQANVAIVFEKELPAFWNGFPVIDGDNLNGDYRPADELNGQTTGLIVGLKFKQVANAVDFTDNPFIIALDDPRRSNELDIDQNDDLFWDTVMVKA